MKKQENKNMALLLIKNQKLEQELKRAPRI